MFTFIVDWWWKLNPKKCKAQDTLNPKLNEKTFLQQWKSSFIMNWQYKKIRHLSTMEIGKALECNHQWWKLECQWMWQSKPKHKLQCFTWVMGPKHDNVMEIKAHKTRMHWFKMGQCATKKLRAHLNNKVIATSDIKNKTPWGQIQLSYPLHNDFHSPSWLHKPTNQQLSHQ